MKTSYIIDQSQLCNWLYKADHHYLAARLLYLHGLLFVAEENAGFSLELLLKAACYKQNVDYKKSHKLQELWTSANPPFSLDDGYLKYIEKLEKVLFSRHPDADSWDSGHNVSDQYDALDFLYLKLRIWVKDLMKDVECIPTELDLAKSKKLLFDNVTSRHGAWDLTTILRRSNIRSDLM